MGGIELRNYSKINPCFIILFPIPSPSDISYLQHKRTSFWNHLPPFNPPPHSNSERCDWSVARSEWNCRYCNVAWKIQVSVMVLSWQFPLLKVKMRCTPLERGRRHNTDLFGVEGKHTEIELRTPKQTRAQWGNVPWKLTLNQGQYYMIEFQSWTLLLRCASSVNKKHFQVLIYTYLLIKDRLFGIVVGMSDYHPRGSGFDSRLYPRNFSRSRVWNGVHPTSWGQLGSYLIWEVADPVKKTEIKVEG